MTVAREQGFHRGHSAGSPPGFWIVPRPSALLLGVPPILLQLFGRKLEARQNRIRRT